MINNKKVKKNNEFTHHNKRNCLGGFTLVETMFAVYILTFTVTVLMTVVANSLFAARYAKDEITANYLLQEVVDYIRNDRDNTVFLNSGPTNSDENWSVFLTKYNSCAEPNGCSFDILPSLLGDSLATKNQCSNGGVCPLLIYNANAVDTSFYFNDDGRSLTTGMTRTDFKRKIIVKKIGTDEIDVIVTIDWKNGKLPVTRSLTTSLMKWQ